MTDENITNEDKDTASDVVQDFLGKIEDEANEIEPHSLQMDRYGFGAWSISKLKVLEKCPLQFYLKYILKIKVPEAIGGRQESLSANVGTAAHEILELVVTGKSIEDSFSKVKRKFVPSILSEAEWETEVCSLEMQIVAFRDRIDAFDRRYGVKRVFTELRIGVTKDWDSCGFFGDDVYFRGIVDLVLQLDNGDAVIIDHKTGGSAESSLRPYRAQLNSYKPLIHHGINQVAGAMSGVHFIRESVVKMDMFHGVSDIEGALIKDLEWSFDCAVEHVGELGFFKHIAGPYCKWCDYASVCKSSDKLLKPIELNSKRIIPIKKG